MFHSILLALLVLQSSSAIIPSQISQTASSNLFNSQIVQLSQNFIYSLSLKSTTTTVQAFFTLVANKQNCDGLLCYYGWVNNYTIDGELYDGYTIGSETNLLLFKLEVFQNKTFSVTKSKQLGFQESNVLHLCLKTSNPLTAQISSLNPFNQSPKTSQLAVYSLLPLDQALKNGQITSQINLQQISSSNSANSTFAGFNETSSLVYKSFKDVLAIDSSNSIILARKVLYSLNDGNSEDVTMQLKLKSSSKFSNIQILKNRTETLSQDPQNIHSYIVTPANIQLFRVGLNFP